MIRAGLGVTRIETLVVWRRRSLWVALIPAYAVVVLLALTSAGLNRGDGTARVADWAVMMNLLLGLVFSASFIGTLGVKDRDGMSEIRLASAMPATRQLLARVVAALTVTLPVLVVLVLLSLYLGVAQGAWIALPAAFGAYAVITIPAVLLILGVDSVLERILPAAFARITAVLLWAWAALFDTPTIPGPSLGGTVFSPTGMSAAKALFNSDATARLFTTGFAWTNIAVLLAAGLISLLITGLSTRTRTI